MRVALIGNMKKFLSIFILACSIFVYSQELKYDGVIKVDSITSKEELYNIAKTWAVQNFNSTNNLITNENIQLGEISGIGAYDYRATKKYMGSSCVEGVITYKFNIYLKDGRYKYVFHSFNHNGSGGPGCKRIDYGNLTKAEKAPLKGKMIADDFAWSDLKEKTDVKIQVLISNLKESMDRKHETSNDW